MIDGDLNVVPAMADNFRVSSDGLTYLFRLREGCSWSDGEPLTAEDFAFAWKSMREEKTRTAFMMEDVEFGVALDERTLEVRLREPRNFFPYILASAWSFPWPKHKCQELGEDWRKPENLVGNGPFMLSEFDDDHALLVANPHWVEPRGNVRELHFDFKTKSPEASERWKEGQYDLLPVYDEGLRDAPQTDRRDRSGALARPTSAFAPTWLRSRTSSSAKRSRTPSTARRSSPARTASTGPRPGAARSRPRCRGTRTGWRSSTTLSKRGSSWRRRATPRAGACPQIEVLVPNWFQFGDALAEQWAALGAEVTVTPRPDCPTWRGSGPPRRGLPGWSADYPDPDGVFRGFFQTGWPFYSDDEILEKLDQARSLGNQDERMRLYHEIDRHLGDRAGGIVPLAYGRTMLLRRPWVHSVWVNPLQRAHLDKARRQALRAL